MALVHCRECNRQVSSQAVTCPHCGAPVILSGRDPRANASQGDTLALCSVGLGVASVVMPYFAAVFLVPAALVCGGIAVRKGASNAAVIGVALGLIGLAQVIYVSQQITASVENIQRLTVGK